jgi:hypothetical protein
MSLHNQYPLKSPQTASRVIDGEAVIITPQNNEVKVLNEVGSRIWDLLDGNLDMKEVSSVISDEFEVSFDQALEDTTEFIDDLHRQKMVLLHDSPTGNDEIADI